jgi:transposase, IS5 family
LRNRTGPRTPEFGVIDTILELHPEIIQIFKTDVVDNDDINNFGRKDTPTVNQIVRAAFYKELKGYDYRELEYAQSDSRICATFIKLDERTPFCFQTFQKFISRINEDTLHKVLVEIVKIAIDEGFEYISKIRQDSTVVKSNIHYPTNNSLVWDCINESHRLLSHLKEEVESLSFIDYSRVERDGEKLHPCPLFNPYVRFSRIRLSCKFLHWHSQSNITECVFCRVYQTKIIC